MVAVLTSIDKIFPWYDLEIRKLDFPLKFLLIPLHVPFENLYKTGICGEPVSTEQFYMSTGLTETNLKDIRNDPNTFLIFNNTHEGYSQAKYNIFNHLTNFGIEYDIPQHKIFYFTSNIYEEEMYKKWKKDYIINVYSFNVFEIHRYTDKELGTFDDTVHRIRSLSEDGLKNWLCLNRVKRTLRIASCYLLFHSKLKDDIKISYDQFTIDDIKFSFYDCFDMHLTDEEIQDFVDSSPKILDRTDFDINWAREPMPLDIYNSTLISIINETIEPIRTSRSWANDMLFYSEKTFKVMEFGQPLIIFGAPGMNTNLKKIGYKTYDSYFDLSFDTIEDHYERLTTQIAMLEDLNENLNIMTHKEKICWLLKDVETIHYNKVKKYRGEFTKKTINRFIDYLQKVCR